MLRKLRIAAEREARGLSQTQLARVIEVHPSWVSNTERGRWVPSPTSPMGKRLVRFFGIPLDDLLREVAEREPAATR